VLYFLKRKARNTRDGIKIPIIHIIPEAQIPEDPGGINQKKNIQRNVIKINNHGK
jgi:hypothetical protein